MGPGAAEGGGTGSEGGAGALVVPPDATNILYIDGLPGDVYTKREMMHIFRPFQGFQVGSLHQRGC